MDNLIKFNISLLQTHESFPFISGFFFFGIKITLFFVSLNKSWDFSFLLEVPQCCHGSQRLSVQMLEEGQRLQLFA